MILKGQILSEEIAEKRAPCSNCKEPIRIGDKHVVVRNRTGKVKGRFCDVACQKERLEKVLSTQRLR